MMWYQTGPILPVYSGRYIVWNLADTTLEETISEPVLEESLYWRRMAVPGRPGAAAGFS
jgi:hypothetical protein